MRRQELELAEEQLDLRRGLAGLELAEILKERGARDAGGDLLHQLLQPRPRVPPQFRLVEVEQHVRVERDAPQVDVVVGLRARGERHAAVDDRLLLDLLDQGLPVEEAIYLASRIVIVTARASDLLWLTFRSTATSTSSTSVATPCATCTPTPRCTPPSTAAGRTRRH